MTPHEERVVSTCLSLPPNLIVASLSSTATCLVIQLACRQASAACPLCQQPSERLHSHYVRTIADVACGGRGVVLKLTVRKFVCRTLACERQIFTERLAEFVQPYARMTNRLRHCLQELGIQLGALPSVRLAPQLGMSIKKSSILRLLRCMSAPVSEAVRILGVDDFCWRRGKTYGTILVDLERGVPIDLLPDRQGETLEKWLVANPSVELISRDRGGEYAASGRRGAPQALQTADRFHVLRNLSEALERGLHRYRTQIKAIRLPASTKGEGSAPTVRARRADRVKRAEQARERAVERYQAVRQLALKNVPHLHIARRLHLSRSTVIRYAKAEQFPERPHHPPRPGVLTPYEPYLYARWKEGQVKAVPLFREIVAQGYKGSRMSVQRYILGLRQQPKGAQQTPVLSATIEMTPHRVVGLLLQPAETLTESERTALNHVRTLHPHITRALSLFEDFHQMILTRRGEALPDWMAAAFHCGLPEFRAFVNKLRQDQQAVQTGLVLHWNNGPVEGQVTRLKLLKRQAYGRAGFDLLRLRVLHRRSLSA